MSLYQCSNCKRIIDDQILTVEILEHTLECVFTGFQLLGVQPVTFRLIPFNEDEMPKATLEYQMLSEDPSTGEIEGAYRLKLQGNFKQHIEPVVRFIKTIIPSSDRTYDPNTYEWFFHEKYYPIMTDALKGSNFTVEVGVTKEAFAELKRKQDEFAKQSGQSYQTRIVPVEEDITKFGGLLIMANLYSEGNFEKLKNWTREQALKMYKNAIRFYHPDLHPDRATQASELNEVWARLKEGYYIK